MEKSIENMIVEIKEKIIRDAKFGSGPNKTISDLFNAYNAYQKEQNNGVDYIFSLENKDDLLCVVKGGLMAHEIAWLYSKQQISGCPLFLFGENYETPKLLTWQDFDIILKDSIEEVIKYVLKYPFNESNRPLYVEYVTNFIIDNME